MSIYVPEQNIKLPEIITAVFKQDDYYQFLEKVCHDNDAAYAVFTFPFPSADPLPFLKHLDENNEFLFFNEKKAQKKTIAAGGSIKEITASGPHRFLTVQRRIEELKKETLHFNALNKAKEGFYILGGFSFFDEIEATSWNGFKSASFTLPRRTIVKNGDSSISITIKLNSNCSSDEIHQKVVNELNKISINSTFGSPQKKGPQTITQTSPVDFDEWDKAIAQVKSQIHKNDFSKIVLARQLNLSSKNKFNVLSALVYFRNHYPNCCSYLIRGKSTSTFLGCSPERLLAFNDSDFETEALAGSMPRGKNNEQDKYLENKLLNSDKNLKEHKLVIDHITKSLQSITQKTEFAKEPFVKKIANVHHLLSPVRFQAKNNISPFEILDRLHPTPALGGYPQNKAVKYLAENCLIKRGWFGAPVGWINTNGSGEFTVAIRCGLVSEYTAKLFAGCGIMASSTAGDEWEESNVKFKPMLSALKNG